MRSTERPASAATRATHAATVVLPTPPLPATTSTRLSVQNLATSICAERSRDGSPVGGAGREIPGRSPCLPSEPGATLTFAPAGAPEVGGGHWPSFGM